MKYPSKKFATLLEAFGHALSGSALVAGSGVQPSPLVVSALTTTQQQLTDYVSNLEAALARVRVDLDEFDKECSEREHTDTGAVWELLVEFRRVLTRAQRGTYLSTLKGWVITVDHLGEGGGGCGVQGPCAFDPEFATVPFKLYDDDGELYYEGRMTPASAEGNEEDVFAPLRWGTRNAGCTELRMQNKAGEWVQV